ncbi:hypothetical protein FACS1894178_8360 [Bacteroidia bacterium]|nr:hypothetical protein FACS1894178_8360 [Bacteroidia bacterium]
MKKIIILSSIFVIVFSSAYAQGSLTQYWLKSYTHNHLINPAVAPSNGYIYIPGVNLNVGLSSNYTFNKFMFPGENGMQTFMHPDVNSNDFLSKLKKNQHLDLEVNDAIFSLGFWIKDKHFFTFDISVKTDVGFNLPKDLFRFMKDGGYGYNSEYNFKNIRFNANVYAELALGWSSEIFEGFRVGGKLKGLVSMAALEANIKNMHLQMSGDQWAIATNAEVDVLGAGIRLATDSLGNLDLAGHHNILGMVVGDENSKFDYKKIRPAGYGGAIDLGVHYAFPKDSPAYGLKLSAGVTDLGFVSFGKKNTHRFTQNGEIVFAGVNDFKVIYDHIIDTVIYSGHEDEQEYLLNALDQMTQIGYGNAKSRMYWLNTRVAAGAEYAVWKDKVGIGALYTGTFYHGYYFDEFTLSFNFRPSDWFGIALSTSFMRQGFSSMGIALELAQIIHISLDYLPFEFTPEWIPIRDGNFNLAFGISLPFVKAKKKDNKYNFCTDGVRGIY